MSVQIKNTKTGQIKNVSKKYADIFVRTQKYEYMDAKKEAPVAYKTKQIKTPPETKVIVPEEVVTPEEKVDPVVEPAVETVVESPEDEEKEEAPKRRGRPPKKDNTYDNRMMVSEE